MIDVHQNRAHTSRNLWSGTIKKLFQTLELQDRPAASAISESLAVFCQEHPRMPDHALSILMARSFCVSGDVEAAEQILRHDGAYRRHTGSWLNVLSVEYPFPELYPLFSARVVRPLNLNSAGRAWVLDLEKIQLTEADRHELIIFQTVRRLTENISNVWKKTNGQGVLGVKGLRRFSEFMRPRGAQPPVQLCGHLHDVLARCARQNGWDHTPSVLQIDL
ncbi:MAG: hypothetical protein JEZ10_01080 [Verrucomicrobia bacterium]|nr:hypothetical protein [Verrucomicrobiota bacterium]